MAIDPTNGGEVGRAFAETISPYTTVYINEGTDFLQATLGMSESVAAMTIVFIPIILFIVAPMFRWFAIGVLVGFIISVFWFPGTVVTGMLLLGFGIGGILFKRLILR